MCIRDSSNRKADSSALRDANLAATLEAAKYSTKAADLLSLGTSLPTFHTEMKHLRLYGVSAQLRQHIKARDINQEELFDPSQETDEPSFTAVAKWFDSIQEYQFVL